MAPPDKYTDIERKLGEPLQSYIADRRDRREPVPWRRIAIEITGLTEIDITGETLRVWYQGITPRVGDAA